MTPPAPGRVVPSTTALPPTGVPASSTGARPPTAVPSPRPAPHLRAVPVVAPDGWDCDNCSLHNAARRRRCTDCGTSRC